MKKILIVSPFKRDIRLYPHLHDFVALLGERCAVEYLYVRERGYFIKELWKPVSFFKVLKIAFDMHKFLGRKNRCHCTIAVDNLLYVLASRYIGGKVILFSHDFISHDNPWRNATVQKAIARHTARHLRQGGKIIIQSEERFALLLRSLGIRDSHGLDPFFLPVSLRDIEPLPLPSPHDLPVVMQIGGINAVRSGSDKLLAHYRHNADKYQLALHGYIAPDIARSLHGIAPAPLTSSSISPPESVHRIVARTDIGFISYDGTDANFYHMAKASGQLAEFLRMGKPIIATGRNNLSTCIEEEGIGVYIASFDQLNEAIETITARYEAFSSACRLLFARDYSLDRHIPHLTAWMGETT